ncbi:hypothetical protein AGMMS50268_13210 [Spirochaetia bacterium]|nr:hypothetical protein AGMMS50268_13210 [Spirochaetia bacterium]
MNLQFREAMPTMRGCFKLRVYRNGQVIQTIEDHNLIVNGAQHAAALLSAGDGAGKYIAKIAFGINGNIPTPGDTAITGAFIKPLQGHSYPADEQVEFKWKLMGNEANGMKIIEFGLLCEDGTLWARKIREEAIPKEPDISLEGEWIIIH